MFDLKQKLINLINFQSVMFNINLFVYIKN